MKRNNLVKIVYNFISPLTAIILFLVIWNSFSRSINVSIILPSPKEVFISLKDIIKEKSFYIGVLNTLLRSLLAFILSISLGFICSLIAYKFLFFKNFLKPFNLIMKTVPTISIILLFKIWFRSTISPILITFVVIFPLSYQEFLLIFNSLNKEVLEMAKVYKVKQQKIYKDYISPFVLKKSIISSISFLSFSIKLTISGEVISSTANCLGSFMDISKIYYETANLFAYTLVAILLGLILEIVLKTLTKLLIGENNA